MLDTFRENAKSWVIQTMIAAIALVFIFSFGPGSKGCRAGGQTVSTWAARVNGEEVPAINFNEIYRSQAERMERYGVTADQLKMMHLREDVMKEVVDEELQAQAALKSGVAVDDEELAKAVRRSGMFDDNGKFDPEIYVNYTTRVESARAFERRFRRRLLAQRESELVTSAVPVTDDELKTEFLKEHEGASIAYVKFLPGNFRDQVQVSPADVDAELKDHLADVQKKFDDTKMLYTEPKAIKARRLFVPVKQDATPAEEAAAKKQIDDAEAALKAGKKWEELVPQFTKDTSPGGELGFVQLGRSTLGRTTEEAIFKLKLGETSDVVHDRFGYEILQAQEERAPTEKKFDDVKRDIATDLLKESKAKDVARAAAQQTLTQLKAGQSLEAQWPKQEQPAPGVKPDPASAKTPHTVVTDEFHPAGGTIPQVGSVPKLSALVFSLSADKRFPDSVVEEQNAFWVVELKSRTRADLSKLADEKDALREKIESTKRNDMRKTWVEQLRKDSKIEENPDMLSYDRKSRGGAPEPDDS